MYSKEGDCYAMAILRENKADFYWKMIRICANDARNPI
jgi:hypothetical protein